MSESLLSNQLWKRIEPLLPKNKKRRAVQYAGRKPTDARKVMTGIIFVLKTGVPWKSLPATSDFPSGHTCRRRLIEWDKAGVWRRLWRSILAELQAEGQLDWERGVVDSSSVRAGHGGEKKGDRAYDSEPHRQALKKKGSSRC